MAKYIGQFATLPDLLAHRTVPALLAEAGGDQITLSALLYKQILTEIGLTKGKVLLYGVRDVGPFVSVIHKLQEMLPEIISSLSCENSNFLLVSFSAKHNLKWSPKLL